MEHTYSPAEAPADTSRPLLADPDAEPAEPKASRLPLWVMGGLYLPAIALFVLYAFPACASYFGDDSPLSICVSTWAEAACFAIGALLLLRQAFRRDAVCWKSATLGLALPIVGLFVLELTFLFFSR